VLFDWTGRKPAPSTSASSNRAPAAPSRASSSTPRARQRGSQSNGGGCYRRTRNKRYVVGYVRPNYGGTVVVVPTNYDPPTGHEEDRPDGRRRLGPEHHPPPAAVHGHRRGRRPRPGHPQGVAALVGVKQDGAWGPATRKALQKLVKVTQDGDWGPGHGQGIPEAYLNAAGSAPHASRPPSRAHDRPRVPLIAWIKALLGGFLSKDGRIE
jgi:hypothetical protein